MFSIGNSLDPSSSDVKLSLALAQDEIYNTFGHKTRTGRKSIHKYGRNRDVGTTEVEISLQNENENYLSSNLIDSVSSTDPTDNQIIYYEGMTIDGPDLSFYSSNGVGGVNGIQLNGQNRVPLPTPLARHTRARNIGSTNLAGTVRFYEDTAIVGGAPTDTSKVHNQMDPGIANNSFKAATSVVSTNYFIMLFFYGFVNRKTSASADIGLFSRQLGQVFHEEFTGFASTDSGGFIIAPPTSYLILPPNTDISTFATASAPNTDVAAGFGGFFADIITE